MKQLRFLIARIDRIGDVVLSTPLPREIKKKYPYSFVAVLVKNYTKDIYFNNPNVDAIITYDDSDTAGKNIWTLVKELHTYRFTHSFMLLPQERLNYILFFAGVPYRVGVGHKLYQFLTFTRYVDRKKYIPLRHEADYCLDMIRKVDVEVENIIPEIHLTENEKAAVLIIRKDVLINDKKLIGINISSGNSAPNLSEKEYKKLILLLLKYQDFQIAIMDKDIPDNLDNINRVIYPNKKKVLRDSIINLAALDVLISNSTGPMHICAALKIPTLSFFCPLTACSPKLWGPLGNKSKIVLPEQKYCDTQCPIDPKKCDYSKPGGLNAEFILEQVISFVKSLDVE
jgi:heptosyltransferase-2